mgnify:CR=1 FL=1
MRKTLLICSLLASMGVVAQSEPLVTFENGKPANADDVNSNFSNLDIRVKTLESLEGSGCSARQQDSSVIIECADGSSGVLASAGTVVVIQPTNVGQSPDISTIPSGNFVISDANDIVLAEYYGSSLDGPLFSFQIKIDDKGLIGSNLSAQIYNDESKSKVFIQGHQTINTIVFASEDCTGPAFGSHVGILYRLSDNDYRFRKTGTENTNFIAKSAIDGGHLDVPPSECKQVNYIVNYGALTPISLSENLTNAAFPVKVIQKTE